MRDIKFRAWREKQKFMLHPHSLVELFTYGELVNPDEVVWMQFTGLKDKNGVEIYEGDIVSLNKLNQVESSDIHFEVKWSNESYSWVIYHSDVEFYMLYYFDFWVIGNIHQNPELLEGKK